jgi:hypothetical protein
MEIAAIISLILSATAATYGAVSSYQGAKIQQKQAEANQQIAENEAQMERAAAAMNANTMRRQARARIAAAQAKMATEGNIGESADAVIQDAYVNLASDLATLHFNSENRAIAHENEALMYGYNSEVAKESKTSAVIGGVINVSASIANSAYDGYKYGAFGGESK